ncbi:hypothetical protein Hamer_G015972 [Homarus americanus]|uniref:Uncharacterized protein n=1 Tax=Homarus americanus TaxID=6706 RepID=A0A8J5ML64_HOMAM|nr:hypothetical protein Hamer_G015972 [Homarus americanus]
MGVGLMMCVIALGSSVGAVACLTGVRRTRSGAVRRLLLLVLVATATALQGVSSPGGMVHGGAATPGRDATQPPVTPQDEGLEDKHKDNTLTPPRYTGYHQSNKNKHSKSKQTNPRRPQEPQTGHSHGKTTTAGEEQDDVNNNNQMTNNGDNNKPLEKANDDTDYNYSDNKQQNQDSQREFSGHIPSRYSLNKLPEPRLPGESSTHTSSVHSSPGETPKTLLDTSARDSWSPKSWLERDAVPPRSRFNPLDHETISLQGFPAVADKGVRPVETGGVRGRGMRPPEPHSSILSLNQALVLLPHTSDNAALTYLGTGNRWEDSIYQSAPELDHQAPYSQESRSQHRQGHYLSPDVRSHWSGHHRIRRSLHNSHNEPKKYVDTTDDTVSRDDVNDIKSPTETHNGTVAKPWSLPSGAGVKTGVAVLLILGGLVGAGVEAGVAQLWHCYAHGYDEGGVSHDILQRTITHTFNLSAYAAHKWWSLLTSGAWLLGGGILSIMACVVGVNVGVYGGMAAHLVLREGVRRLTFHSWVFANGTLAAFSYTFSIWLLQEMTQQESALAPQTGALAITLASEGWHSTRSGGSCPGGTMGVGGVGLMLHFGTMWATSNVAVVVLSHVGLGFGLALMWISVKNNALLLATVTDQEREAWASWWCWRLGLGLGAVLWGMGVQTVGERIRPLLLHATLISAAMASTVGVAAIVTRRNWRTRRRVYHTLDLNMADDDNDEDDDPCEDDWLVKRAKKEGITL